LTSCVPVPKASRGPPTKHQAQDSTLPPWEHANEHDRQTWLTAMSAVAGQNAMTRSDAAPNRSLRIQAGDESDVFNTEASVGASGRSPSATNLLLASTPACGLSAAVGTSRTSALPTAPGSTGVAFTPLNF